MARTWTQSPHERWWRAAPALRALRQGSTLCRAARAAGVHPATLCRWRQADGLLAVQFANAFAAGRAARARRPRLRPVVRIRSTCPDCGATLAARRCPSGSVFWRCDTWPVCAFASWRPPSPDNCSDCGAPLFWSHRRQSLGCDACGRRRHGRRLAA